MVVVISRLFFVLYNVISDSIAVVREPTPVLLVFEWEMIGNCQFMSWSQFIVNTGYLAKSTLFQDVVHVPSAGSQLQEHCVLVTHDGKRPVDEFYCDSSHCVYSIEIQKKYTGKHNTLMP